MNSADLLIKGIESYNISATDEMIERFKIYSEMLIEWNKKMNLTNITEENEIVIKHYLDSISCVQSGIDFSGKKVIDVGTGAGFPGIPLKIVMPEIKLTLFDSLNKRVIFLNELMKKLGLECEIIHGRAEDYGKKTDYREAYHIVLSRAVANLSVLVEYTIPFAEVGGYVICQKGPGVFDEAEDAKKAINILGGKLKEIISTRVYSSDLKHYLALIEKVKICPGKYPRKAGTAEKNPIK